MSGLLVSVRNAEEAAIAVAAGVDVIDVKEPLHGSLGAASVETIRSVIDLVGDRAIVSAACGELRDWDAALVAKPALTNLSLAKIALANCDGWANWEHCWRAWAGRLPPGTNPVAVVYADRAIANSPAWQDILALAARAGAAYVLVDTFDKTAGTLFDHWPDATLNAFANETRAEGLGFVLAGSLQRDDIARAREFGPDFVAIRGAACRGGRTGALDESAIRDILTTLGRSPRMPGSIPSAASEIR